MRITAERKQELIAILKKREARRIKEYNMLRKKQKILKNKYNILKNAIEDTKTKNILDFINNTFIKHLTSYKPSKYAEDKKLITNINKYFNYLYFLHFNKNIKQHFKYKAEVKKLYKYFMQQFKRINKIRNMWRKRSSNNIIFIQQTTDYKLNVIKFYNNAAFNIQKLIAAEVQQLQNTLQNINNLSTKIQLLKNRNNKDYKKAKMKEKMKERLKIEEEYNNNNMQPELKLALNKIKDALKDVD